VGNSLAPVDGGGPFSIVGSLTFQADNKSARGVPEKGVPQLGQSGHGVRQSNQIKPLKDGVRAKTSETGAFLRIMRKIAFHADRPLFLFSPSWTAEG